MNTTQTKKLYRSEEDRVIGGIAGGFAKYFNVDSLVVRIIFIVIALVSQVAPAVLAYLVAMIFIPKEGETKETNTGEKISEVAEELGEQAKSAAEAIKKRNTHAHRVRNIIGFIFIVFGLYLLFNRLFPNYHLGFGYLWPWVLIFFGLFLIFKRRK